MKLDLLQQQAAGPVVLKTDRLDASRKLCRAGMAISPNVDGWPLNRVMQALRHGYAEQMAEKPAPVKTEKPSSAKVEK